MRNVREETFHVLAFLAVRLPCFPARRGAVRQDGVDESAGETRDLREPHPRCQLVH